ncbi:MAG: glutathione peroxidase [Neisseriaceae bacterium]
MTELYDFSFLDLQQQSHSLAEYRDRVILIVNTASGCGFTPQLSDLAQLHRQYYDQGLIIIGFPCNQFMQQEPLAGANLQQFCEQNHGVSFLMADKVMVNGPQAHPLWRYLKTQKRGFLGTRAIKWNFTKFLINRQGQVIKRYGPRTPPAAIIDDIVACL